MLLYFQVTDAATVREYDVTEYVEGEVESGVHGNETGEKPGRDASHAADKATAQQVIMWISFLNQCRFSSEIGSICHQI